MFFILKEHQVWFRKPKADHVVSSQTFAVFLFVFSARWSGKKTYTNVRCFSQHKWNDNPQMSTIIALLFTLHTSFKFVLKWWCRQVFTGSKIHANVISEKRFSACENNLFPIILTVVCLRSDLISCIQTELPDYGNDVIMSFWQRWLMVMHFYWY